MTFEYEFWMIFLTEAVPKIVLDAVFVFTVVGFTFRWLKKST